MATENPGQWFIDLAKKAEEDLRNTPDDLLGPAGRILKTSLPPREYPPLRLVEDDEC